MSAPAAYEQLVAAAGDRGQANPLHPVTCLRSHSESARRSRLGTSGWIFEMAVTAESNA
jgi:hypothetical protein